MLKTAQASRAIAESVPAFESELVDLTQSVGRILQQPVHAERDQPPFDRVTMDGIAVSHKVLASGQRTFPVQGTQHAGDPVQTLEHESHCIEVMTGSVLPGGSDCIIPVERIALNDGVATIKDAYSANRFQFVHPRGSDYVRDTQILKPGRRISPMDIAVIASCGLDSIRVSRQPAVRVISTGNELILPGNPIKAHQIRLSNGPSMIAMLAQHGFSGAVHEHVLDDRRDLEDRLAVQLQESDVLILSGGVSMGKADFVPGVLSNLGVECVFHKISQRPGKPMWFGVGPNQQVVFALPGNPVSMLVCCRQYVLPALLLASGFEKRSPESARLAEDVTFNPDLTCFLPVKLSQHDDGVVSATPVQTNTSGDFAALSGTDGYVELEKEKSEFPVRSVVRLRRWNLS